MKIGMRATLYNEVTGGRLEIVRLDPGSIAVTRCNNIENLPFNGECVYRGITKPGVYKFGGLGPFFKPEYYKAIELSESLSDMSTDQCKFNIVKISELDITGEIFTAAKIITDTTEIDSVGYFYIDSEGVVVESLSPKSSWNVHKIPTRDLFNLGSKHSPSTISFIDICNIPSNLFIDDKLKFISIALNSPLIDKNLEDIQDLCQQVVTALIKYDHGIAELSNIVVTGKGFDLYHFSKCPIIK